MTALNQRRAHVLKRIAGIQVSSGLLALLMTAAVMSEEIPLPEWIKRARIERAETKRKYPKLFEEVSAILYRHDPIGIGIALGAPPDEYAAEAGTIIPRLKECRSEEDVVRVVLEEFQRWFGQDAGAKERYAKPSREIWQAWQRLAN